MNSACSLSVTAVHRHEARAQQLDLLRLQGVGQHHPEVPRRHRQQPLHGLLRQVQQVPEETSGHHIWKHAPQVEENYVLVFHMPQVPSCLWGWQHMLE